MKRFAWVLAVLLGFATQARAAYDGPTPLLTYDQTLNGIRVILTSQPQVLNGGYSHFVATIHVPVEADNVGQNVVFQFYKNLPSNPPPDPLIDSCVHTVTAPEAGTTVVFQCEFFQLVPGPLTPGNFVDIYPKVTRNSSVPGNTTIHDGDSPGLWLHIPIGNDDGFEPNNSQIASTTLSPVLNTPLVITDSILGLNDDYFKFVAPGGAGSADIQVDFWSQANDVDLWIYDQFGTPVDGSFASNPERVIIPVTPGVTYYFAIQPSSETNPTFYDLTITVGGPHVIDGNPTGTPNPVTSGGTVSVSANATDSHGHALSYIWSHSISCPTFGTFSDRFIANPTWTAFTNNTGVPKTCTLIVEISDGIAPSVKKSYIQTIDPVTHSLTISSVPSGTPNPVASSASVALSVTATDTFGHSISYAWQASCPTLSDNGSFNPSANVQNPTWNAPSNNGSEQDCTLSVTADDGQGLTASANYVQTVLGASALTNLLYFAEGATINGFFETQFALLNPDPDNDATVALDFQLKGSGTVLTHSINVPAHSRATIDASTLDDINPGLAAMVNAEFSTVVRSNLPLVADRTMTWDGNSYGSHAETAVSAPASKWYLAEGATIGNFELYYLIQNPNPEEFDYTVTYLLPPPAAPITRTYHIGASTRENIAVHFEPGLADVEVSAIIESPIDKPIIVERAMYLTTGGIFYGAGHESAGIRSPETQWFFAEGATGSFFDLFILIGNPNPTEANVTATFLFDDGTTCSTTAQVGANSRFNFWVDTIVIPGCPRSLADAAVSTRINSDIPVIAERAMWWPGPSAANWAEAHNAAGATETGIKWGLAGGEQGGAKATETYILIANTSNYAGTAVVTVYMEDGSTLQKTVQLAANSRTNVPVGAPVDAGGFGASVNGKRFGAVIESQPVVGESGPAQIVVERAMYSNGPGAPFWAAGTDVLATKLQ
ncbi:MAG: hypothetical protein AB7I50_09680 [Vicinamibacterales bacterium]